MKRLIGNLVAVVVMACGAAVGVAGPSTAMPRDQCMDEQNYLTRVGWLTDSLNYYNAAESAWENATRTWDDVTWEWDYKAYLPDMTVQVQGDGAYATALQRAGSDEDRAFWNLADFVANTVVC